MVYTSPVRHTAEHIRQRLLRRSRVNPETGCREWTAATRGGYGRLWDGEKLADAHRLSHEVFVGPIPAGMDVLHHCDNPGCIEWGPGHIYSGTPKQNTADMISRGRHLAGRVIASEKRRGRPSAVRGSDHPRAKLTKEQVVELLARAAGGEMASSLARRFAVSDSLVRSILKGKSWGWFDRSTLKPILYRPPKVTPKEIKVMKPPARPRGNPLRLRDVFGKGPRV